MQESLIEFFKRLAFALYENNKAIYEIVKTRVFDKTFNNQEFEVINIDDFFMCLRIRNMKIRPHEK